MNALQAQNPNIPFKELKTLIEYVREAQLGSQDWRAESWRDNEMHDGSQWTQQAWDAAVDAGIDPLTVNRTFTVDELLVGLHVTNQSNIVAKGRTQYDTDMGQMFTECIQFVMDQNYGPFQILKAVRDQLIPGIGYIGVNINPDPRKEKIRLKHYDWTECWWDPFASPWLLNDECRYFFRMPWMDVDDLTAIFPERKAEIDEMYNDMTGTMRSEQTSSNTYYQDESWLIEDRKRLYGLGWVNSARKRIRPCQMFYPVNVPAWFAVFADGRAIEFTENMDPREQFQLVNGAQEICNAVVRKMITCTFVADLELQHMPTPYPHDEFPFIPFVGYTDRWKNPYGVPRQIRGQNEEVNYRRSMIYAQLRTRRIRMEEGTVDPNQYQTIHDEANKLNGMMIVKDGKLATLQIDENQIMNEAQFRVLQQSEQEIQQISGANDEQMGYRSNVTSGIALEKRQAQGATITAPLGENKKHSLLRLGEMIGSLLQGYWKYEKVFRVTDKMTGQDKEMWINQRVQSADGSFNIKNNITQGKYDFVISEAERSDTVRERNLNLVIEAVKKSPPNVVPILLSVAFEMSDLPNKETLMAQLKPLLGVNPENEGLTPEELKQKALQELQGQKQAQSQQDQLQQQEIQLKLENLKDQNDLLKARIEEIMSKIKQGQYNSQVGAFKVGADVAHRKSQAELAQEERKSNFVKLPAGQPVLHEGGFAQPLPVNRKEIV